MVVMKSMLGSNTEGSVQFLKNGAIVGGGTAGIVFPELIVGHRESFCI
jgi:hypothetical protein